MGLKGVKSRRRNFNRICLLTGLTQLAAVAALGGCSADSSMATVLKSGDTLLRSAESGAQAAEPPVFVAPLRVSRLFFRGVLRATVVVGGAASTQPRIYESEVSWDSQRTSLPPPDPRQGPVLGDFRDIVGCAILSNLENTGLCFDVMPDGSDVGINDREMRLQGPQGVSCSFRSQEGVAASHGGRPAADVAGEILPPSSFHLVSAQKSDATLILKFAPAHGASCGASSVLLTLKRI